VPVLAFLAGSPAFLDNVLRGSKFTGHVVAVVEGSHRCSYQAPTFKAQSVAHADVGGATTSHMRLRHNLPRPLDFGKIPYSRRLRHLLDSTARVPRTCNSSAPPDPDSEFNGVRWLARDEIHPGGLVPAHLQTLRVRCHSVFSSSKWVSQKLVADEVARVFDMPVSIEKALELTPVEGLPFLSSTPLKLLQCAAAAVRDALGLTGGVT